MTRDFFLYIIYNVALYCACCNGAVGCLSEGAALGILLLKVVPAFCARWCSKDSAGNSAKCYTFFRYWEWYF